MPSSPKPFKPILAVNCELMAVEFPVAVSPKIDGIRCIIRDGIPVSRSLKPIRNVHIFKTLSNIKHCLDGELIASNGNFQLSTSAVMKGLSELPWEYHVFDLIDGDPDEPFSNRFHKLKQIFEDGELPHQCKLVPQEFVYSRQDVEEIHLRHEQEGHEGTMLRSADGPYKYGRSTLREGYLMKLKQFSDAEARVIGFEELLHNDNEATVNALGLLERSSHKDNKRSSGMLGSFIVKSLDDPDIEFKIGTGLTEQQRIDYWKNQGELLGSIIKYKFFEFGVKHKPRHPVFLGFRHEDDM